VVVAHVLGVPRGLLGLGAVVVTFVVVVVLVVAAAVIRRAGDGGHHIRGLGGGRALLVDGPESLQRVRVLHGFQ
jgi:hypothetical protein